MLSCNLLESRPTTNQNFSVTQLIESTPTYQPIKVTETLPAITAANYLEFTSIHSWNVQSILSITGIALSPNKQLVALFTLHPPEEWWLEIREAKSGETIWNAPVGTATYNALAFSPDGKLLATGTGEGNVRIWDVETGNLLKTLERHKYAVRFVAFSPDGTMVASGASDNTARVWQVENGFGLGVYKNKTDVRDIAFSPDSQFLAVTSNNINVYHLPSRTDEPIVFFDQSTETRDLGEVAFSPNGIFLIGAGDWYNNENNRWRKRILVWDFPFNTSSPIKIPVDDAVEDVAISPDGQLLICVYKDRGKLLLIEIAEREIVGTIDIGPKLYMSYSPDISTFAVVSTKTTVTIWGISP